MISRNLSISLAFLLLLSFAFTSCAPVATKEPAGPIPPAQSILNALRQQESSVRVFAGRGNMSFKDKQSSYDGNVVIAASRPSHMRLQAFDFMGRPALTMAVDPNELRVLDYRENRFFQGPATAASFRTFLPVGLQLHDVITILSGGVPLRPHDQATVRPETMNGRQYWVLSLLSQGFVQRIWLAPNTSRVSKVEMGRTAFDVSLRLEYSDHRLVGGVDVPFSIKLSELKNQTSLSATFEEVKVNETLPPNTFTLKPPPSIKVEPISAPHVES